MSELLDGSSIPAPDQQSAAVWPPQLPVQPPRAPHVRPVPGTRVTRNDGLHTGKDDGCAECSTVALGTARLTARPSRLSVALRRLSSSLLGSLDKVISRAAALDPAATTFFSVRLRSSSSPVTPDALRRRARATWKDCVFMRLSS